MYLLNLKDRTSLAVGFLLLAPAVMMFSFAASALVDPYAITIARAEKIDRAIHEYRQIASTYPIDLGELSPNYLFILPGPLTGRGRSGATRAGRITTASGSPTTSANILATLNPTPRSSPPLRNGHPPTETWMCDQELERIKETGGL